MYAIYGNIYHQYTPNVTIYGIHGSYGIDNSNDHMIKKMNLIKQHQHDMNAPDVVGEINRNTPRFQESKRQSEARFPGILENIR
jgi:hypothetical protein